MTQSGSRACALTRAYSALSSGTGLPSPSGRAADHALPSVREDRIHRGFQVRRAQDRHPGSAEKVGNRAMLSFDFGDETIVTVNLNHRTDNQIEPKEYQQNAKK